jgi:hypothetical protein
MISASKTRCSAPCRLSRTHDMVGDTFILLLTYRLTVCVRVATSEALAPRSAAEGNAEEEG